MHKKTSFTTLTPDRLAMPYFNNPALAGLTDNATYGVGMVVNVHWDRPITDRAAAERTMTVTTTPAVTGSWYWVDDQNVHWRPRAYYATGTKVTVTIADYGKKLGDGLYGQESKTLHFTIGASHVSVADDTTHHVKVYENGKLVRDMPTSMGRGGSQVIKGRTITYWTPSGTYTVIGHVNPQADGLHHLRSAAGPGRLQGIHLLRHPDQHRRHLPAPDGLDGVGPGPPRRLARVPEPEPGQRQVVLQLRQAR